MLDTLLNAIAPHSCCGCGKIGSLLCEQCKYDIVSEPYAQCIMCGIPSGDITLCLTCKKGLQSGECWCVGSRTGALKLLLDQYKFSASRAGAAACADLLDERLPLLPAGVCVVPVPTAAQSVRVRGFDHMNTIVRLLAAKRGYRRHYALMRKTTGIQHFKSRRDRLQVGAKDFACEPIRGPVLLVDDIVTTGATLRACVESLRQAGAERVYCAIIARQPLDE